MTGRNVGFVVAAAAAVGLAGCATATPTEYALVDNVHEHTSELHSRLDSQDTRISENERGIEELRGDIEELRNELEQLREDFDARIEKLEDRLVLSLPVHFEFDAADIRPVDEPLLDRFASTVRNHLSEGVITVEGFADPAGTDRYNQELSKERAQAVKQYLVDEAGLSGDRIRAIGYGENRLITPEAGPGRSGLENRRVNFVIEFGGEVGG